MFAGRGPRCRVSLPAAATAGVTAGNMGKNGTGGTPGLGFLCQGICMCRISAGKEHLGRDQTCINTAGGTGREAGDNNISGTLQAS